MAPGKPRRRLLAAASLLLGASLAPSLPAQSGGALNHYRRGEELYEEADFTGALAAFQRAYALDPKAKRGQRIGMHFEDYDPAFQLGRVHARLGNFEEATRFFAQCAAEGYTEKSPNAGEYLRWRAVVDRALAAGRAHPTPAPMTTLRPPEPTATALPAPATTPILPASSGPPTPILVAGLPPTPAPRLPAGTPAPSPSPTAEVIVVAPFFEETLEPTTAPPPSTAGVEQPPAARGVPAALFWAVPAAAGGALVVGLLVFARRRRPQRIGEGSVSFGRYAIGGLLGAGRTSFVYEARDRKSGNTVALRIRRPDRLPAETDRFDLETKALERGARTDSSPGPKLLARGALKVGGRTFDYVATERLSGRNLLDLARSGRRRLDATLSLQILGQIAARLRQARGLGLSQDELATEDVFLLDPVPLNAGNPFKLRLFGLVPGAGEPARDAESLATIAAELFRGRTDRWEEDEWAAQHIPTAVRLVLARARDTRGAAGGSFDEIEKALVESSAGRRLGQPSS